MSDAKLSHWIFDEVLERGWVHSSTGEQLPVIGSVTRSEAHALGSLILENGFRRGIETGVARVISTLALAQAFQQTGGRLTGFDPCQKSEHGDATLVTLQEFGLDDVFELRREPAQTGIAKLKSEPPYDFVFADDVHNFQHRLVVFFLADHLLTTGGILAFHDLWLPLMKKLLRFIRTLGHYELIPTPSAEPQQFKKHRLLAGAIAKIKPYSYWWPNGFSNLLVLRKTGEFEQGFTWFRNF